MQAGCVRHGGTAKDRFPGNDYSVVWRVLDDVEGDVAEVAFVGDAISAAEGGFAIAKDIDGKSKSGRDGAILRVPEPVIWTVRCGEDGAVADLFRDGGSAAIEEIGIEIGIVVVLDAEVLVPDAVIEGEPGVDLPLILPIAGPVVEAIGAGELRGSGGCGDLAG